MVQETGSLIGQGVKPLKSALMFRPGSPTKLDKLWLRVLSFGGWRPEGGELHAAYMGF